jgi:RNA polymerase sigma factor (TIGR02999 family)
MRDPSMGEQYEGDLTVLIEKARTGGSVARDRLFRAIYEEFHRIAVSLMSNERPGHTLQPSALVDEAVLRLIMGEVLEKAPNRHYLFGAATRAMRQALVDHHRRRKARDGRLKKVPLDEVLAHVERQNLDIEALSAALDRLSALNERQGLVVALRFFAGLTVVEVAEALDVSVGTVELDWRFARAWLRDQLAGEL